MEKLCREIGLPQEAAEAVLRLHADPDFNPDPTKLLHAQTWQEGLEEVRQALGDDPQGYRMLCCQLRCALDAWKTYEALGFSREMYVDTMAAFSRFVKEHIESYGTCGFDRGYWTVRQISCTLFRIGQLEYELIEQEGRPVLSLHIPSDVNMELAGLRQSYLRAREILNAAFPAYADAPIYCHSWLLSPTLRELLPPTSRILSFQRSFDIQGVEPQGNDVLQWVFKNRDLPLDQLPQQTSLQRSLKAFLVSGGEFLEGEGYLCADPFCK